MLEQRPKSGEGNRVIVLYGKTVFWEEETGSLKILKLEHIWSGKRRQASNEQEFSDHG